jgi:hypothetical protein
MLRNYSSDRSNALKHLLAQGWNINQKDSYGATILMYMVGQGDINTVKFLLSECADPLVMDSNENSVLSLVQTILQQLYYAKTIAQSDDDRSVVDEEIGIYEEIQTLITEAQIMAVTTTDDVVMLSYPSQMRSKRKLESQHSIEPALKKVKGNSGQLVIPKEFNLFDTLPRNIVLDILNFK